MEKEEKMWHQRSRVQWLQCGDKIHVFFMEWQPKGKEKIILSGLGMKMAFGKVRSIAFRG